MTRGGLISGLAAGVAAAAFAAPTGAADPARYAASASAVLAVEAPFAPAGGKVRVTAYDSPQKFLMQPAARFEAAVNRDGVAVVDLGALPAGFYSFAAYFDADGDGKLRRGRLGRPKEPFVFSNNVHPRFSRPSFEETAVRAGPGAVIVMTLEN